jgi:hypothetical protein
MDITVALAQYPDSGEASSLVPPPDPIQFHGEAS